MTFELGLDFLNRGPKRVFLIFVSLFLLTINVLCQKTLTVVHDSILSEVSKDSDIKINNPSNPFLTNIKADSLFSFRSSKGFFPSLLKNFAAQASAPFQFDKKELLISGVSSGIIWLLLQNDDHIDKFARVQKQDHKLIAELSPPITRLGGDIGLYSVIGAGLTSAIFEEQKGLETSLQTLQAVITSGVWVRILKLMTGRERPFASYVYSKSESGHWYGPFAMIDQDLSPRRPASSFDSFPSGHAATAFSIATVVSTQYRDIRVIPIISYSLASLVGISRLTEHEHWASDVFVGALIGYACGRQVISSYNDLHNETIFPDSVISKNKTKVLITGSGRDLGISIMF